MKTRFIPKVNLPFLAIAILMAIVLWFFVKQNASLQQERFVSIPVTLTPLKSNRHFTVMPDRLELKIIAQTNNQETILNVNDLSATVDTNQHESGDLLPVLFTVPAGYKFVSASQTTVKLIDLPQ
jgi:hypothetical protein